MPIEYHCEDLAAAMRFYGALFGWDFPEGPDGARSPVHNCDRSIALMSQGPGVAAWSSSGLPATSETASVGDLLGHGGTLHVLVEQLDEVCARIAPLGGRLETPPAEAEGGRAARLVDPFGASLGLLQRVVAA